LELINGKSKESKQCVLTDRKTYYYTRKGRPDLFSDLKFSVLQCFLIKKYWGSNAGYYT